MDVFHWVVGKIIEDKFGSFVEYFFFCFGEGSVGKVDD